MSPRCAERTTVALPETRPPARYTERLAEAGIETSVVIRGDSCDNALAESVIGLYKTEVTTAHPLLARSLCCPPARAAYQTRYHSTQ